MYVYVSLHRSCVVMYTIPSADDGHYQFNDIKYYKAVMKRCFIWQCIGN